MPWAVLLAKTNFTEDHKALGLSLENDSCPGFPKRGACVRVSALVCMRIPMCVCDMMGMCMLTHVCRRVVCVCDMLYV